MGAEVGINRRVLSVGGDRFKSPVPIGRGGGERSKEMKSPHNGKKSFRNIGAKGKGKKGSKWKWGTERRRS